MTCASCHAGTCPCPDLVFAGIIPARHIPGSPTLAGNGRADYLPRVSAPTLPSLHTQAGNDLLNNNTNGNSFNHGESV